MSGFATKSYQQQMLDSVIAPRCGQRLAALTHEGLAVLLAEQDRDDVGATHLKAFLMLARQNKVCFNLKQ